METQDEYVLAGGGVYLVTWEMTEEEAERVETELCESDDKAGMTPEEVARVFHRQTGQLGDGVRAAGLAGPRAATESIGGVVTAPASAGAACCNPSLPSLPSAQASMLGRLGRE